MAWDIFNNDPNVNFRGIPHGEVGPRSDLTGTLFSGRVAPQAPPTISGAPNARDALSSINDLMAFGNSLDYNTNSGGGGGGSGGGVSAADLAQYDQAMGNVQSGINRLPGMLESGFGKIDASYNNALNELLLNRNRGETAYNENKLQTGKDYVGAKNTIGSQAGANLSGIQRLLGARGAGGGTAYNISAPQAIAREATIQRGDVGNQFGANNQTLDTNWNNFLTDYDNQGRAAKAQRLSQRDELSDTISTNRATLLQTLAQLSAQRASAAGGNGVASAQPYLDQANTILDRVSNYQTAPISYQTQAYQAPELAKYIVNPQAAPTLQGQTPTNDYFSPYLASLLGRRQQPGIA